MKNRKKIHSIYTFYLFSCLAGVTQPIHAAGKSDDSFIQGDTLRLNKVIYEVMQLHPSVQLATEALNAADAKISLAKSGFYPILDLSASYTRIGPVPSFDIPSIGHMQLYPENNYAASLNYRQNIYDFGETSKHLAYEKESKNLTMESIELVKQHLTMKVVGTFYSLLYLQEAIKIKFQQLRTLQEHLDFIKKKEETGSATSYEVLSTQVRLSGIESEKLDLEAAWMTKLSVLNSLLGQPENTHHIVDEQLQIDTVEPVKDSIIEFALDNRSEMLIALENEKLARLRLQVVKSENNPVICAYASAGGKNGYIPDLNTIKVNYVAGIALSVPLYDASRNKSNVSLAKTSIQTSQFETEITRRQVIDEVIDYYQKEMASRKKIEQFEKQFEQAKKAYEMANVSFRAGTITNIDMLYSANALSESELQLIRSKTEYLINMYGLRIATGERLYYEAIK
jgi:outer membrane protein TolC